MDEEIVVIVPTFNSRHVGGLTYASCDDDFRELDIEDFDSTHENLELKTELKKEKAEQKPKESNASKQAEDDSPNAHNAMKRLIIERKNTQEFYFKFEEKGQPIERNREAIRLCAREKIYCKQNPKDTKMSIM